MGGPVPLGYDVKDRKLVATRIEADTVNQIFRLYVELGTVRRLKHGTPVRPCSWFLSLQCDRTCARCAAADQGAASPEGAQRSAGNARSCRVRRGSGKPGGGDVSGRSRRVEVPGGGDRTVPRLRGRSATVRGGVAAARLSPGDRARSRARWPGACGTAPGPRPSAGRRSRSGSGSARIGPAGAAGTRRGAGRGR